MTVLAILDLGFGNTRSVALAFKRLGITPTLTDSASTAAKADRLVVPGVGAAASAMALLGATGLAQVLIERSRPTLGICLGMQLMFESSEEDGGTRMLGILPGEVKALRPSAGAPVPNMGWCALERVAADIGLRNGDQVYFAHSFACPDGPGTAAFAAHAAQRFPAVVRDGPRWAAQFHPERSSAPGAAFLRAFLAA